MCSSDDRGSLQDITETFGFASYFNHLLKTKISADVTFILSTPGGEIEVIAHQLVLAMRSSYFADLFYGNQKIKEKQTICLENVNLRAFQDMIRYCYDCMPGLETLEDVCILYTVAYDFKVISLTNLCRSHLLDVEITPENVFSILEVSECMENTKLRDKCHRFLQEKTKDVMESYKMAQITPAMVHVVLDLPRLSLNSETELIKWLFDWAYSKVEEEGTVGRNAREYLQNMMQDINFLALPFEEFAKLCKDYPNLFTSEEIASICLNIAHPGTREMPDWYGKDVKIREYVLLRAKSIDKDIDGTKKYFIDILGLEVILQCSMEATKYFSEKIQYSLEKELDIFEVFFYSYIACKYFASCCKIGNELSKMLGKGEVYERLKMNEQVIQTTFQRHEAIFLTLENGGLIYFLENEPELKKAYADDVSFENFKKDLPKYEEQKRKMLRKKLEEDKEYGRLKEMLKSFERHGIDKMLDNLQHLYKSHAEKEITDEFLKEIYSLVTKKITSLSESYFDFIKEFQRVVNQFGFNL